MNDGGVAIRSGRFGELMVGEDEGFEFPGLPGFPRARRFIVREHDRGDAFGWLISLDQPDLAFVIASPWAWVPDYAPRLEPAHLRSLDSRQGDRVEVMAIASVSNGQIALNLAAPIVVNLRTRRGIQAILEGTRYSTREIMGRPG